MQAGGYTQSRGRRVQPEEHGGSLCNDEMWGRVGPGFAGVVGGRDGGRVTKGKKLRSANWWSQTAQGTVTDAAVTVHSARRGPDQSGHRI